MRRVILSEGPCSVGVVVEQVCLPEGLGSMPPGPALAAVLAGIDRSRLANGDTVTLAQARLRQVSHDQAQLLADLREVGLACGLRPDDSPRRAHIDDVDPDDQRWAEMELAAALTWTRAAAASQLDLGLRLADLPAVASALSAGLILSLIHI